ncbi:MAG: methyltransferase [Gammaproteobacteria bacterium]|nr:methyltransferase [Gammaproteobacteria bacterium]
MDKLPAKSDVREFRAYLDANDYNEQALNTLIGTAKPPQAENEHRLSYVTRELTTRNALIRLFLLGMSIDQAAAADILPTSFIELCTTAGLLDVDHGRLRSSVVIVAVEDLLFASDAFRKLGGDEAVDFVLPASTHSTNYLRRLTMRTKLGSMLDLGCGCGVHALFASRHSGKVVATDISPAATRYTTFNAWLNDIDNVDCIVGNLFEPVADQSFDLIVSNPPFVLGPDDTFVYRDNPLELDGLCQQIVDQAPSFLNKNGCLQMLGEIVEFEPDSWHERMKSWFAGTRCDTWVLHSPALHPVHYVSKRANDLSGNVLQEAGSFDRWIEYFETRKVSAIHPVMVAMRRREGNNWLHVHNWQGDVESDAGEAVRMSIASCDFLERCRDDDALLTETLVISPDISLEQQFTRQDHAWEPRSSVVRLTNGIPMDAEIDMPILAFLNQLDGEKPLQTTLETFSKAVGADRAKLTADLLPILRLLIGRGILEAANQS